MLCGLLLASSQPRGFPQFPRTFCYLLLPIRDAPAANLASALADEDMKSSPSVKAQASLLHFLLKEQSLSATKNDPYSLPQSKETP
jgi:hypothetical protein